MKKHICAGLLAHVDAGKTTLAEAILYRTGMLRRLGRVDHQDAFLDTDEMERTRGITIFSKQARVTLGDCSITLLDTPGHVDFAAEMERTLQVLDYAVLVISGADGVQGHVETLWRLLARYQIPTFLFVNKMDQDGTDEALLMKELQERLDQRCVRLMSMPARADEQAREEGAQYFRDDLPAMDKDFWENAAMCDDGLLERYLEGEETGWDDIAELVRERKLFPCFFGSALKVCGVDGLLAGMEMLMCRKQYPEQFGARVYKITRDGQGNRLTHLKVTGGSLKVKQCVSNRGNADGRNISGKASNSKNTGSETANDRKEGECWEEKIDQIRLYAGDGYETVTEAAAGEICAVTGLSRTFAGEGLGAESAPQLPVLEPVLTYRIGLPEDVDAHTMLRYLRQLEEEEPELSIVWEEASGEICAQVMGEVQMEVLKNQIRERFGVQVSFGEGSIVYKETIAEPAEGVGHFEPLRHYAEVHLLLEPLERGMGLQFETACSEDRLDRNWQRLAISQLEEKRHRGVLCGTEVTDMRVTLLTGRAHLKHTEGGDFREAAWRALRQGLMRTKNILLEPVYEFRLELPAENVGRAMTDVQRMYGSFAAPQMEGEQAILTGKAPVACMRGYQQEVTAYTRGRGHLFCTLGGYEPCHNAEEVIAAFGYDPEADLDNPPSSVFCAHGAGFIVPWDQVEEYMHLEACYDPDTWNRNVAGNIGSVTGERTESGMEGGQEKGAACDIKGGISDKNRPRKGRRQEIEQPFVSQEELEEIFNRTYRRPEQERSGYKKRRQEQKPKRLFERNSSFEADHVPKKAGEVKKPEEEYLLVDGYNIIFSWENLRELAKINIESARGLLMDVLCNYQGFHKCTLILVFDAYRVEGGQGSVQRYHNIHVVFTKEAETADQYIEKTVHRIGRGAKVTVATSDALEQVIIYGQGARRMSARELLEEVEITQKLIREQMEKSREQKGAEEVKDRSYLFDHLSEDLAEYMEDVRLGRREF